VLFPKGHHAKGLKAARMVMIDQNTRNCCINQHAEIIRKIQDTAATVCVWAPSQLPHAHHKTILIVCSSVSRGKSGEVGAATLHPHP